MTLNTHVYMIYMRNKRIKIAYAFTFLGEKTLHYISASAFLLCKVFGQKSALI